MSGFAFFFLHLGNRLVPIEQNDPRQIGSIPTDVEGYARWLLEMLVPHLRHGDHAGGYEYWISEREPAMPGLREAITVAARTVLRTAETHLHCSAIQALAVTGDENDVALISTFQNHKDHNVASDVVAALRTIRHRKLYDSKEGLFHYPLDSFKFVNSRHFSKQDFDLYPVWAEYESFSDRDIIQDWGIDRKWIDETLENWNRGHDDLCYPILYPYPPNLGSGTFLFFKARFVTAGGELLTGFVQRHVTRDRFAVFDNEERIDFWLGNHWIDDRIAVEFAKSCDRLRILMNCPDDPLFPIRFETDFLDDHDRPISGTLGSFSN